MSKHQNVIKQKLNYELRLGWKYICSVSKAPPKLSICSSWTHL